MRRSHRRNINEPGHAHELTFTCYRAIPLLSRDRTRQWLVDALSEARRKLEFDVWAWVIMPEHAHVILRPRRRDYDMAVIRRLIKLPVARQGVAWLTEHAPEWPPKIERTRGGRKEHLFWQSGGGYDRNIIEPATLLKMIDYLHNNPVRRGLVQRAFEWEWSSAAWYVNLQRTPLQPDPIPPEWMPGG